MVHTIEHIYDVDPERLWALYFFDTDFERSLHERLGVSVVTTALQHEGAGSRLIVRRHRRLVPRRVLPSWLRRLGLVRGREGILEVGEFSGQQQRFHLRFDVAGWGRRIDLAGDFSWTSLPDGRTLRVWRGRCDVRLPWLGPRIEAYLLGQVEQALTELDVWTRRWLRERPHTAIVG